MVMYAGGVALNLSVYLFKKTADPSGEPSFFTGYNSFGAVALLLLNAMIGIIIT